MCNLLITLLHRKKSIYNIKVCIFLKIWWFDSYVKEIKERKRQRKRERGRQGGNSTFYWKAALVSRPDSMDVRVEIRRLRNGFATRCRRSGLRILIRGFSLGTRVRASVFNLKRRRLGVVRSSDKERHSIKREKDYRRKRSQANKTGTDNVRVMAASGYFYTLQSMLKANVFDNTLPLYLVTL